MTKRPRGDKTWREGLPNARPWPGRAGPSEQRPLGANQMGLGERRVETLCLFRVGHGQVRRSLAEVGPKNRRVERWGSFGMSRIAIAKSAIAPSKFCIEA